MTQTRTRDAIEVRGVPARRFAGFGTTIFAEMTRLAREHGAVNLSQGFPDFDGPEFVREAARGAIAGGQNQYAPMPGVPELQRAIASSWARAGNREVDPASEVTVTSGCTEGLAASLLGLVDPGDEVVLFEPFYDSYRACVAMAGAVPRVVTLRDPGAGAAPGEAFSFDADEFRSAFGPRTRAVLVNTPHNPTGKVFSRAELGLIAEVCIGHGCIAVCDEVYEHLTFDPARPHVSLASLPGMGERTVTLSSLGKSFSLTGWKVGWAIAPPALTSAVRMAHQFLTFAAATPLQHAAAVALGAGGHERESREAIEGLSAHLRGARDVLCRVLADVGLRAIRPDGAYFIMTDFSGLAPRLARRAGVSEAEFDDAAFCRFLTTEVGVAAIPPSSFYKNVGHARRLARFAFCKKIETLEEAARRLEKLRSM